MSELPETTMVFGHMLVLRSPNRYRKIWLGHGKGEPWLEAQAKIHLEMGTQFPNTGAAPLGMTCALDLWDDVLVWSRAPVSDADLAALPCS